MEPSTKKYLTYGGVGLAAFLVYKRWRHEDKKLEELKKSKKEKKKNDAQMTPEQIAAQAPPATAGQFSPVGMPPQYPPPAYPQQPYPAQYPQQYPSGYPQPYPGYPQQYPNQYPGTYPGYPTQFPITTLPQPQCQNLISSVIGMSLGAARQVLAAQGIAVRVVSVNGRATPQAAQLQLSYAPTANLATYGGIVRAASCAQTYPVTGYPSTGYPVTAY